MREFWVWCEYTDGQEDENIAALISRAREMAETNADVCLFTVSSSIPDCSRFPGAYKFRYVKSNCGTMKKGEILACAAAELKPELILFTAGISESEIAARAAALLDTGLSADCTALRMDEENLVMHRPAFGGGVVADIVCPYHRPQMATVRYGAIPRSTLHGPIPSLEEYIPPRLEDDPIICLSREICIRSETLSSARIIVSGGLGVGSRADYTLIEELAAAMKGMPAASRAAVDAGYTGWQRQVGQTGQTVRPDIYLAFGISGNIRHIAGMHGARFIASVNTDRKAPIFEYSDMAIVADWRQAAEFLLKQYK